MLCWDEKKKLEKVFKEFTMKREKEAELEWGLIVETFFGAVFCKEVLPAQLEKTKIVYLLEVQNKI